MSATPAFPLVIALAGEPKGKGRPQAARVRSKDGREFLTVRTPARTRSYESALHYAGACVMGDAPPLDINLAVTMTATFAIPTSFPKWKREAALRGEVFAAKKPDFDNVAKCCDALNGVVWCDDKQIVVGTIVKKYGAKPELRIVVRPVEHFTTSGSPAR